MSWCIASTFDNVATIFRCHASFVPFIQQTGDTWAGWTPAPQRAGGIFRGTARFQGERLRVEVVDPTGGRVLSLEEATQAQNIQFNLGRVSYEIHRPNLRAV